MACRWVCLGYRGAAGKRLARVYDLQDGHMRDKRPKVGIGLFGFLNIGLSKS